MAMRPDELRKAALTPAPDLLPAVIQKLVRRPSRCSVTAETASINFRFLGKVKKTSILNISKPGHKNAPLIEGLDLTELDLYQ